MVFDSDRARVDPGYYDDYEAEANALMAINTALGAEVVSDRFGQSVEDFDSITARIENLEHKTVTRLGRLPFTGKLVRVKAIELDDNLPKPFESVGMKSFRDLIPTRKAKLLRASFWAILGSSRNSPEVEFAVSFDNGEAGLAGSRSANVRIPFTSDREYDKMAIQNILSLIEND